MIINGDGDSIRLTTRGVPHMGGNISSLAAAGSALHTLKSAIQEVAVQRGSVGAMISRVQAESDSLALKSENIRQAISRIMDTDVATESTNYSRQTILIQSGTAMLAQANLMPQSVLKLLN